MALHIRILAWSYLALGGFVWLLSVTAAFSSDFTAEPDLASDLVGSRIMVVILATLFCALPISGAIGLLNYRSWSRGWMMLISALGLGLYSYVVPAVLGAYGLWILTRPETIQLFDDSTEHRGLGL